MIKKVLKSLAFIALTYVMIKGIVLQINFNTIDRLIFFVGGIALILEGTFTWGAK